MQSWQKRLINNIVCLLVGFGFGILIMKIQSPTNVEYVYPDIPTDVLVKDSIFRDSIYIIKDSIIERIIYVEKNYEETVSNILSNSDSANIQFFTEYIEHYNNQ